MGENLIKHNHSDKTRTEIENEDVDDFWAMSECQYQGVAVWATQQLKKNSNIKQEMIHDRSKWKNPSNTGGSAVSYNPKNHKLRYLR
jgi:hypothetical protein